MCYDKFGAILIMFMLAFYWDFCVISLQSKVKKLIFAMNMIHIYFNKDFRTFKR